MAVNVSTDTAELFPSRTSWPACADVGASIPGTNGLGGTACPTEAQVRSDFLADDSDQVGPQENTINMTLTMIPVQLLTHSVGVQYGDGRPLHRFRFSFAILLMH